MKNARNTIALKTSDAEVLRHTIEQKMTAMMALQNNKNCHI
jgi:hypothetical protein